MEHAVKEGVDGSLEYKVESLWKSYHVSVKVIGDSCMDACKDLIFGGGIRGV